jgi:hypothetical protein
MRHSSISFSKKSFIKSKDFLLKIYSLKNDSIKNIHEKEILECLINLKIKKVDFKSHNIQNGPKRHQQIISHRKKKWPKWHKTAIPPK